MYYHEYTIQNALVLKLKILVLKNHENVKINTEQI